MRYQREREKKHEIEGKRAEGKGECVEGREKGVMREK